MGLRGRDRDRPRPRGERATSRRWYCGRAGSVLPYHVARLERPCRQGNPPAPDAVTLGNRPARLERPCRQGDPPAPDAVTRAWFAAAPPAARKCAMSTAEHESPPDAEVLYDVADRVATVTLNRPASSECDLGADAAATVERAARRRRRPGGALRAPHRRGEGILLRARPQGRHGGHGHRLGRERGRRGDDRRGDTADGDPAGDGHSGARRDQRRRRGLRPRPRARLRHAAREHLHALAPGIRQARRRARERRDVVPASSRRMVTRVPHRDVGPRPRRRGIAGVRAARHRRRRRRARSTPRASGRARSPRTRRWRSRR